MLPPFPRYIPARGPGKVSARQRIIAQWRGIDLAPLEGRKPCEPSRRAPLCREC